MANYHILNENYLNINDKLNLLTLWLSLVQGLLHLNMEM